MKRSLVVGISTTLIAGCAINPQTGQPDFSPAAKAEFKSVFDSSDPCSNNDRNIGTVLGVGAGALLGHYLGKSTATTILGAGAGGLAGMLIGHAMDQRRCNLYRIAQQYQMKLVSAPITAASLDVPAPEGGKADQPVGLDVQMGNPDDEFVPGTAILTPKALEYLGKIADQYNPKAMQAQLGSQVPAGQSGVETRQLLVVGHTDERDGVSGVDLARLSEARARAVAEVFRQHGVPAANISYQGAGDALPIASNGTQQGRSDNNRVEVVDVPTVNALKAYASTRTANPANFSVARAVPAGDAGQDALVAAGSGTTVPAAAASAAQTAGANGASLAPAPAPETSAAAKPGVKAATASPAEKTKVARGSSGGDQAALPAKMVSPVSPVSRASSSSAQAKAMSGFNGEPIGANGYQVNLGASTEKSSMLSFITAAHADTPVIIGSCLQDHPHVSSPIRSLANNQPLKLEDALPGLYGQPWLGSQGDAGIALLHVYVPSDGAAPIPPVTAEIYRTNGNGAFDSKPLARYKDAPVNVYRGTHATLYRVFLNNGAQCVDLRVPVRSANANGLVVYPWNDEEYKALVNFSSKG
ncbi:OmpA family protein [Paraburkholderia sp. J12]|uniref:OmpA family protein n=1 Tax=Paraburkholderia sp. J12 TaxID=2805432 RepID=UPI002ABDA0B0|nr:OmpA family protein [Paraburkholderia sp. J12]